MPHFYSDHVGLSVADLDRLSTFYAEGLGLTEIEEEFAMPDVGVRSVILRSPEGFKLELIERQGSTPQSFPDPFTGASIQGFFHWALSVDDLDAAFATLVAAGAAAVSEPADAVRSGARFAYVHDPEGNLIELIQPASA
ncbi:glyoxalase [Frondihabitans sp. PAMC 28766]|uniref:VOC family protein n=1 Tax=Frondihabitans sp. PAMC 28766 TaxID=1795630 RepID=UPI00078D985A|nr:VOC family protein [Frondihabitans sp. PAMC 28766]AMM21627.1 glyoxalase [Frondihabitans sp. PAMC 28766]